jgi:transposase
LPWQGNTVTIEATVRKFFCDNRECQRRIFTEPLPRVAARYARRTERLADALRELTFLVGGEAAARIAKAFGLIVSPDALCDSLKKAKPADVQDPRFLGVDDFAFRRGQHYGTILVDLEKHCPIDLLPDRDAESLAQWLKNHSGVQIVTRDRAEVYKNGITVGAPNAVQVADRWHLLKNLGDTLERFLHRHHCSLVETTRQMNERSVPSDVTTLPTAPPKDLTAAESAKSHRQQKREERYQRVRELHQKGMSQRAISQQTGLDTKTIRKYLHAPICPHPTKRRSRSGLLTPFQGYLKRRWSEGCHNAAVLFDEVKQQGYCGRYTILRNYLQPLRARLPLEQRWTTGPVPRSRSPGNKARYPGPATVRWWLLGKYHRSDEEKAGWQRDFVERLVHLCPDVGVFQALAQEFSQVVKGYPGADLDSWLTNVQGVSIAELRSFAKGLLADEAAVRAALSLPFSNGQVEGQVNRLKLIKRSMYGRGSFDLLRMRILHRRV